MSERIPKHILDLYGSARRFRSHKRAQVRIVLRAINDLSLGCAYIPDGSRLITEARMRMEKVAAAVAVKRWGR